MYKLKASTLHKFQHKPLSLFLIEQLSNMELWHKRMGHIRFQCTQCDLHNLFFFKFLINASKLIHYFFDLFEILRDKKSFFIFMDNNLLIKNRLQATLCVLNKSSSFFQYARGSSKSETYGSNSSLIVVVMIARALYLCFVNVVVDTT